MPLQRLLLAATALTVLALATPAAAESKFSFSADTDGPGGVKVGQLIVSQQVDFAITGGDNAYGRTLCAQSYQRVYGQVKNAGIPIHPTIGNHDYACGPKELLPAGTDAHSGGSLKQYTDYWKVPRYYSITSKDGLVYAAMLNSDDREPDGVSPNSKQALWLKADLAASSAPWKVVAAHHQRCSSSSDSKNIVWPIEAWGADLYLSAHEHNAERCMLDDNKDGRFIPYLVGGLGGHSRKSMGATRADGSKFFYKSNEGAWFFRATPTNLYGEFRSVDGVVHDSFTLTKGVQPPPPPPQTEECPDGTIIPADTDCPVVEPPAPEPVPIPAPVPVPPEPAPIPPPPTCTCPQPAPTPEPAPEPVPPVPAPEPAPVPAPAPPPSGATLTPPVQLKSGQTLENVTIDGEGGVLIQLEGTVNSATIRKVRTLDGYEAIRAGRGDLTASSITNILIEDFTCERARRSCGWWRGEGANITIRRATLRGDGEPHKLIGDLEEGMAFQTNYKGVLIEDSTCSGFEMLEIPGEYTNGDCWAMEREVVDVTFRRVTGDNNTDAGFDLKTANVRLEDVSASNNGRNFRLWAGATGTTATCGNWTGACLWMNGLSRTNADAGVAVPVYRFDLFRVTKTSAASGYVFLGSNDVKPILIILRCEMTLPAGQQIFNQISPQSQLGPGCKAGEYVTSPSPERG